YNGGANSILIPGGFYNATNSSSSTMELDGDIHINTLVAGGAGDTLYGMGSGDHLYGGAGSDHFSYQLSGDSYSSAAASDVNTDTIVNFHDGGGATSVIDLSQLFQVSN